MEFLRVGDKLLSRAKLQRKLDRILELRCQGLSQQEVARELDVDRTFISRLETLAEVRKGGSIGLVAFPVANASQVRELAKAEAVDFVLVMTDQERWQWVEEKSGTELFNALMALIAQVRTFDTVILAGSDYRLGLMQGLLDRTVVTIEMGGSPLTRDVSLDLDKLRDLIRKIKGDLEERAT
ncbi:MAG: helix-turn-helix domain-containing protein [Bacillota bacterium]